jgi:cytochrome b6-f complex iron-sulfur subunit
MADDQDLNIPGSSTSNKPSTEKKPLPPMKSASGGGARAPLPPLNASSPSISAARPKPASAPVALTSSPEVPAKAASATPAPTGPVQQPPVPRPVATAPKVVKPKQDKPPENDQGVWRMSRKNFLNVAGWFAFFSFLGTATVGAIRLMVPRVLYEQPSAFKAGLPEDYIVGEVNEKYKDEFRVWIVREAEGFYALSAICTHLGCTPRWLATESKFKCPCHGSGYHKDGVNFEGPTPRPLERLKITLADDGQILIDRAIKFLYEKQEWSRPDAFLKYT